jgi:putative FmdB family regulatory protein
MPIYEYRCQQCDGTFELLIRDSGAARCPDCGSSSLIKLLSVPHVSTAEGTRQAGHTCCGREERCDAPPCGEGETCWRG